MVLLRDGRTLIGYLRSVDQFANLVLHRTIERIHVGKEYGDIPRGVFIVRGENVVLLGEIVRILLFLYLFSNKMFLIICCYRTKIKKRIYHYQKFLLMIFLMLKEENKN